MEKQILQIAKQRYVTNIKTIEMNIDELHNNINELFKNKIINKKIKKEQIAILNLRIKLHKNNIEFIKNNINENNIQIIDEDYDALLNSEQIKDMLNHLKPEYEVAFDKIKHVKNENMIKLLDKLNTEKNEMLNFLNDKTDYGDVTQLYYGKLYLKDFDI